RHVGYNMSFGGDGGQNSITEEVRRKISETKKGVPYGPLKESTKELIRQAKLGKPCPPEVRARIAATRRGQKWSAEAKARLKIIRNETKRFKLSPSQIREILSLLSMYSDRRLALQFGVDQKTIWRIRHGLFDF